MDFTCLLDIRCALGESPVWDDRRKLLFFVDVMVRDGAALKSVRSKREFSIINLALTKQTVTVGLDGFDAALAKIK